MKMLNIYVDFIEDIEDLGDAEVGRLFRSMLQYAADDSYDADDLKGNERFLWKAARKMINRQWAEYREMCERNRKIATTRYDSSRHVSKKNDSYQEQEQDKEQKQDTTPLAPFTGQLGEAVNDWLAYKKEKRQGYKPTGLKSLFTQIRNAADKYGDEAVAGVIRDSMSSNYMGIMFDRLKTKKNAPAKMAYSGRDDTDSFLKMLQEV